MERSNRIRKNEWNTSSNLVQDPFLFFFFPFGLDIMKAMYAFFSVRQKSLRLIKKSIEPCQYKNVCLPQYCFTR